MRKWLGVCILASVCNVQAGQSIYNSGTSATVGKATVGHHINSVTHNPAAGELVLRPGENFRLSYVGSGGFYGEYGDVDNFSDDIDDLIDLFDDIDALGLSSLNDEIAQAEQTIASLLDAGYFKGGGDFPVPAFPMVIRPGFVEGVVVVDADVNFLFNGALIATPDLVGNFIQTGVGGGDPSTNTSIYIKGAEIARFGVGYSRPVFKFEQGRFFDGKLLAGVRLNFYSIGLSKQIVQIDGDLDSSDEVEDVIEEAYDDNQERTTNAGLDVGVIWQAERFQAGLTWMNINEPEFDYGALGGDCVSLSGSAANDCFLVNEFADAGVLVREESFKMHGLMTVDASFMITPRWYVSTSLDLADYNDPVGDELQYFTVATTHTPRRWAIPAWRVGYRANLAGEELTSLNFGTTLAGVFNLDLVYGLEEAEVDGDTYPRSFGFNIGFEERF